jgi:hypothetical protein
MGWIEKVFWQLDQARYKGEVTPVLAPDYLMADFDGSRYCKQTFLLMPMMTSLSTSEPWICLNGKPDKRRNWEDLKDKADIRKEQRKLRNGSARHRWTPGHAQLQAELCG